MQPIKRRLERVLESVFNGRLLGPLLLLLFVLLVLGKARFLVKKNRKFVKGLENLGVLQLGLRFPTIAYSLCGQPGTSDGTLLVERQAWLALIEWASELIGWRLRPCLFYVAVQLP